MIAVLAQQHANGWVFDEAGIAITRPAIAKPPNSIEKRAMIDPLYVCLGDNHAFLA